MSEGLGGPECCQGKVLVITNDFPPRRGGIETFVHHLCAAVPSDRLVVYTSSAAGAAQHDAALDYPVIRDRSAVLLPTRRVARRGHRVAEAHGCDRVVFGAAAPLGLLASGLRRAGVRRVVALTHGHEVWWARTPLARQALSRISESVDALTYVSDYCRAAIARALPPAGAARLTRLSPGVDTQRFRPGLDREVWRREWQISLEQPVVLAAGRLVARKGHDTLIRVWPAVVRERPDAVLVIVGDGPHRRTLQKRIARQGLTDSTRLVRDACWSQMPEIYAAADV
nr:glycosyltransferase family 4 protein [Nocardioidaceae bacterium]